MSVELTLQISQKLSAQKQFSFDSKEKKRACLDSLIEKIVDCFKYKIDLRPKEEQQPELVLFLNPKYKGGRIQLRFSNYNVLKKEEDPPLFDGYHIFSEELGCNYYISSKRLIENCVQQLMSFLNGNRIEMIQFSGYISKSDSYWNPTNWKTGENRKIYNKFLYPMFLAAAKKLLISEAQNILEVCAGDGELAREIFDRVSKNIESYHLLELNEPSREMAKKSLAEEIKSEKAFVHTSDITEGDYFKFTKGKQVDLVIGCGALNYQVLESFESALKSLKKIAAILKSGGALLLSGWTGMHIYSKDLEDWGFTVHNMMIPGTYQQFYVATKK